MPKPDSKSKYWYLYWVESDGFEDCFIVARSARSACSVEIHMNGFDPCDVRATKIAKITPNIERSYRREHPDRQWPDYVYGKRLFEKIGAQFRTVNSRQEMLLEDVVYEIDEYAPCSIARKRPIGRKAVLELRSIHCLEVSNVTMKIGGMVPLSI
jgi:hypothetical protein